MRETDPVLVQEVVRLPFKERIARVGFGRERRAALERQRRAFANVAENFLHRFALPASPEERDVTGDVGCTLRFHKTFEAGAGGNWKSPCSEPAAVCAREEAG